MDAGCYDSGMSCSDDSSFLDKDMNAGTESADGPVTTNKINNVETERDRSVMVWAKSDNGKNRLVIIRGNLNAYFPNLFLFVFF